MFIVPDPATRCVWGKKALLVDKSCLSLSGVGEEFKHLIGKKSVVNGTCDIEKKLAWKVKKIRGVRANKRFGKG